MSHDDKSDHLEGLELRYKLACEGRRIAEQRVAELEELAVRLNVNEPLAKILVIPSAGGPSERLSEALHNMGTHSPAMLEVLGNHLSTAQAEEVLRLTKGAPASASADSNAVKLLKRCLPELHGGSWVHITSGPCGCKKCLRAEVAAFLNATDSPTRTS